MSEEKTIEERELAISESLLLGLESPDVTGDKINAYIEFQKFLAARPAIATATDLKPCPRCKNTDLRIFRDSRVFKIACKCGEWMSTASSFSKLLDNWNS